jgi:hypothetical protein
MRNTKGLKDAALQEQNIERSALELAKRGLLEEE